MSEGNVLCVGGVGVYVCLCMCVRGGGGGGGGRGGMCTFVRLSYPEQRVLHILDMLGFHTYYDYS